MEDKINELETRTIDTAEFTGELSGTIEDLTKKVEELTYRVVAAEHALSVLTNTLHVVDAASLLAVYSLIKTDSLRQPDFKSKQDVIDSGCSDAITRMLKTVQVYMNNEKKSNGKDETEGR